MIPTHLTVPILITDAEGHPHLRNERFRAHPLPLTAHPLAHMKRSDRFRALALHDGACQILSLTSRRVKGPLLLWRQKEQLIFLFSPILRQQLFFEAEALQTHLTEPFSRLLPSLFDGSLRRAEDIAAALVALWDDPMPLPITCYASIAALTLRLLFGEDVLIPLSVKEEEAILPNAIEAIIALGRLIDLLADCEMSKDEPPSIGLHCENRTLFFDLPTERLPIGPLTLPLGVEIVSPFVFRENEALLALLFSTLFDMLRTPKSKIHQIIT